jgi:outer membrane receptor protein involved in Fe transport
MTRHHHFASAAALVLAMTSLGSAAHAQNATAASGEASVIDEVIVTATKRQERLREIAGGVSAATGEQLSAIGAQDFKDYLTRMPGVAFNEGPSNNSTAVIRGVGTTAGLDQGQGTTGYFINDVPMTEPGYTVVVPDIDAFDVARVEVLRGPQGTLFGSASLGGAINYISRQADASGFDAAIETGLSTTKNSAGEENYRVKGMVNLPIIKDKLAVRLTAGQRVDAGYIDNVGAKVDGSNDLHTFSGRGSIVFTPSDDTKLTYLGLYQKTKVDDSSASNLNFGILKKSTNFEIPMKFTTELHSLRLDQELGGFATLTAIAAYNHKTGDINDDFTASYGGLNPGNHYFLQAGQSDTYSYEVRLASPKGEHFDWLVGATAIKTKKGFQEHLWSPGYGAANPTIVAAGLAIGDEYYWGASHTKGDEKALFGEANIHFGKLTVTGGGRLFDTESNTRSDFHGIFYNPAVISDRYDVSDSGFAPKASVKFQASADTMVYALASKGYRFGSPNTIFPLAGFATPKGTTSDSLWNYEAGLRTAFADRKVLVDLTAFYIDWTNLQVRLNRPDGYTYGANAGAAVIKGLEGTTTLALGGFSLVSNATYLNAKLDETVAGSVLVKGKRLPSAAKWRISNTLSYRFAGEDAPTVTLLHRYVSKSPGFLNEDTDFDAYNIFDARVAIKVREVTVSAFMENIGDKRAQTFGYQDYGQGASRFVVRPRTFGVQFNWAM